MNAGRRGPHQNYLVSVEMIDRDLVDWLIADTIVPATLKAKSDPI